MLNDSSIQIELTTRFKKDLVKLAKRYRSIRHARTPNPLTTSGEMREKFCVFSSCNPYFAG